MENAIVSSMLCRYDAIVTFLGKNYRQRDCIHQSDLVVGRPRYWACYDVKPKREAVVSIEKSPNKTTDTKNPRSAQHTRHAAENLRCRKDGNSQWDGGVQTTTLLSNEPITGTHATVLW